MIRGKYSMANIAEWVGLDPEEELQKLSRRKVSNKGGSGGYQPGLEKLKRRNKLDSINKQTQRPRKQRLSSKTPKRQVQKW